MSEFLIRIRNKRGPDGYYLPDGSYVAEDTTHETFYKYSGTFHRGDVIAAQDNGWPWGNDELTLPFWRIIKMPSVDLATARTLLAPEIPVDPLNPSLTIQRRGFKFDLDGGSFGGPIGAYLADDTRVASSYTFNISNAVFNAQVKIAKPRIDDPAVVG